MRFIWANLQQAWFGAQHDFREKSDNAQLNQQLIPTIACNCQPFFKIPVHRGQNFPNCPPDVVCLAGKYQTTSFKFISTLTRPWICLRILNGRLMSLGGPIQVPMSGFTASGNVRYLKMPQQWSYLCLFPLMRSHKTGLRDTHLQFQRLTPELPTDGSSGGP